MTANVIIVQILHQLLYIYDVKDVWAKAWQLTDDKVWWPSHDFCIPRVSCDWLYILNTTVATLSTESDKFDLGKAPSVPDRFIKIPGASFANMD